MDARGLASGTHAQHIHAGTACPTRANDTNGDRIVDLVEGVPVYGAVLISLDADLANLAGGTFPEASGRKGFLDYDALSSVAALEAAIGGPLHIETRHVVLHGVAADTNLPGTVQPPNPALLPVACGEIRRVQ